MKYWDPYLPFGQHISVSTLVIPWKYICKSIDLIIDYDICYATFVGQKMTEFLTYSVFVKVWYSQSVYAVFKSSGVTVLSKPVTVNNQRGAAVCCRKIFNE